MITHICITAVPPTPPVLNMCFGIAQCVRCFGESSYLYGFAVSCPISNVSGDGKLIVFSNIIWIYPMQICMAENISKSSTEWLLQTDSYVVSANLRHQAKTPIKKDTYNYLPKKEISLPKTSTQCNQLHWSSVRHQSKPICNKISWVTEIWKEQFVEGKIVRFLSWIKRDRKVLLKILWKHSNCFLIKPHSFNTEGI